MQNRDDHRLSGELFERIQKLIRTVRRRRRLRLLTRGLFATVAVALGVFLLSSYAMDRMLYGESAVIWIRALAWITVVAFALRALVLPLLRRVTDRQIALYIEEHEPELESALITSLEVGPRRASSAVANVLQERLLSDTIERCERIEFGRRIERSALQRGAGGLAALAAGALLLILISPAFLRHGASLLLFPWTAAAADNPYQVSVWPESGVFAKGADIRLLARTRGFADEPADLVLRVGDGDWERRRMIVGGPFPELGEVSGDAMESFADHEMLILAATESFEFFVESSGLRSSRVTIDVIDLPYTESIDLLYRYPSYSGSTEELVEDGGDIAALPGTQVELRVHPTIETEAARLVVEGSAPIDMERVDTTWRTTLDIGDAGFYHVEMMDARGRFQRASADYAIRLLDDEPPSVSIRRPGRDLRVSKIEEIFVEAYAEDDYGLLGLDLTYSLNGSEPVTKRLTSAPAQGQRKTLLAGYTFFLEDFELQDGDFLSYYATARDGRPGVGNRERSSDIYFLEIRPFSQDYRRADGGGGGGGGQGGAEAELSKRQREVVAATFRLKRDRPSFSEREFGESVATVSLSQARLREQVQTLITRMGNRAMLMGDDEFGKVIGLLEGALLPMQAAVEALDAGRLDDALASEQEALAALQRAESMFRDARVSFNPGGGGGGESGGLAEDLADLFELELDKLRNQYETVQRGSQQQADQEVDEVEEKLRELARRQQREVERQRQLGTQGAGGGENQQQLIDETEELARRLERLSREQGSPEMRQTAEQLQRAADQMKRSGSEGQAGAGRSGLAAVQALEDARRLLDKTRRQGLEEGIEEAQRRMESLRQQQEKIGSGVDELASMESPNASGEGREQLRRTLERKQQLERDIKGLESELDRLARKARSEQPELARSLQEAANEIRTSGVAKKIEYSRGILTEGDTELAQRVEDVIDIDLDSIEERLGAAAEAAEEGQGAAAGEGALEQARELLQGLESLERRLRERGAESGRDRASGAEGEQGEPEDSGSQSSRSESSPGQEPGQQSGQETGQQSGQGESGQTPGARGGSSGDGQGAQSGEGSERSDPTGGQQRTSEGAGPTEPGGARSQTEGRGGRSLEQLGREGNAEGPGAGEMQGQGLPSMGSGTASGSLQPGAFTAEELRQLGREISQRRGQASELRQRLEEQGVDTADLRDIERQMGRLDTRELTNDPLALEALRQNIEELRQFEFSLWRQIGGAQAVVRTPQEQVIPEGYEEQAETYFRSLAEDGELP